MVRRLRLWSLGLGLVLLFLLRLVLRLCLSALERFIHVLGRLVGLAVVVDRHLGFAFLGDAHHLIAVGIYAGGLRLALFGIILQVYGTVVATPVLALTDEYLFPGEVVSLFLLVERDMVPLIQTLGVAVGVMPVVFEALPGLLPALLAALLSPLCLLLVLLTVLSRVDKGDVTLGCVVLQVGGEFLSVGEFDVLFLDKTAVFEYAYLLHCQIYIGNLLFDKDFIDRYALDLVCEAVYADEAFMHLSCRWVFEVNGFAEIARVG